jgi:hypothetical protein
MSTMISHRSHDSSQNMAFITLQSGSLTRKILGVHLQPLGSRHDPHPFPSRSLHCVVVVAGSAIIASTILDTTTTTTTETHITLPYNSLLRLRRTSGKQQSYSRRPAPSPARAATRATLPCALSLPSTHGSVLTPTALPILLNPRLYATLYESYLDLIFNNPRARAGKSHQEFPLDMLSGQ